MSSAALALGATTTLAVGIGIAPAPLRNTALLAMELAALARYFPGRVVGGIGHGVDRWMEQVGETVASPLTLLEEVTTATTRLLHGERVHVEGRTAGAPSTLSPPRAPMVLPSDPSVLHPRRS